MAKVVGFDESVKRRATCYECAAIVEYTKGEIQTHNGIDYSGGSDGMEYVKCPNCSEPIVLRSW